MSNAVANDGKSTTVLYEKNGASQLVLFPAAADPFAILEKIEKGMALPRRPAVDRFGCALGSPDHRDNVAAMVDWYAGRPGVSIDTPRRFRENPSPSSGAGASSPPSLGLDAGSTVDGSPTSTGAPERFHSSPPAEVSPAPIAAPEPEGRVPHSTSVATSGAHLVEVQAPPPGKFDAQKKAVLELFRRAHDSGWTRREIARETGLSIYEICGAVDELLRDASPALVERGTKECSITKNAVKAIYLSPPPEVA